jgi:hypothetical protein
VEEGVSEASDVIVTLPAHVQMIDETGYVWTFLHERLSRRAWNLRWRSPA